MLILKADTQVKVRIGPFVDETDGVTPQTGITLGAADQAELLKHDGAATVNIAGNTWAAITGCDGWYDLTLTTTDTNTEGLLTAVVQDASVCLPVFAHFMVVAANVYDSLYAAAATDYLKVKDDEGNTLANEAKQDIIDGVVDDILVDTAEIGAAGAGLDDLGGMSTGMKAEVEAEATDALNAYDAPTKAEMDTAHGLLATEAKQDTIDTVVDGIQTDLSNVTDGLGALKALIDTLDTVADAIKAKTDNLPTDPADDSDIDSQLATIDTVVDAIKAVTDALPDAGALSDLAAILTDTDTTLPATLATISGYVDALETRLTATRAGYLDELAAANLPADIDTLKTYCDILDHATNGLANIKTLIDTIDTVVDAVKVQTDDQPAGIPKGVELANFVFFMVLSSDHITPATSKTIMEEISKDGGAFAACTNTFAEIGNGFYKITLTAAEMTADVVALKFTETDCDQTSITLVTSA